MVNLTDEQRLKKDIRKGNRCLVSLMGRHFMVEVVEVEKDTISVTFPGCDYPPDGVFVHLEFHDPEGFTHYHTEVVRGPQSREDLLVLSKPGEPKRNVHRDTFRVPTDLTVQVRDQVHVRKYDALLLDISAGGCLLQTDAPFDFDTSIEITLSLPGEATHTILGQIIHIAETGSRHDGPSRVFGVKFVGVPSDAASSIGRYVWLRLRDLYQNRRH